MKMSAKGNDYFETPSYIFNQLNRIFHFNMDVACNEKNFKCRTCITEEMNSLNYEWYGRCFCNPPFSKKADFIKKAHDEVLNGNCPICVMILPLNSMDTKAWHKYIEGKFSTKYLRVEFLLLIHKQRNLSPAIIVVQ